MDVDGPGRGTRDNGLRCAGYTAIADLDPRVADALLTALRDVGIAAYAAPTPGATLGYLEAKLPDRPIDRLWVDGQQVTRAREILEVERVEAVTPPAPADPASRDADPDFDAAWQQVLASLQSTPDAPMPSWPDAESLGEPQRAGADVDTDDDSAVERDDEHFVPPPPPPLPRLRRATVAALVSMAVGLLILGTNFADGSFNVVAIVAILGGVASIIWHMRNGPPTDSGWDDGAVV
ncbi:MAG: hypothetical protein QOF18_498 [Frankiaceae bacterium]|jgi:hypothetical protein|nr:hypothetical protein [Frankiaceae bacterium]